MRRDEAAKRNIAPIEGDAVFPPVLCARGLGGRHADSIMSHSVFCVLGDPVHSASLHRHGNVQCTGASACFVDLDGRGGRHRSQRRHGDPYQPGADGFWFWFWERAVIGGRGGTRRTTGLKHTGPIDGQRRHCLSLRPGQRVATTACLLFGKVSRWAPTCQKVTQLASLAPAMDVEDGGQSAMTSRAVSTSRGLCAGHFFPFSPLGAVPVA